jgi:starvation-inducible DNA-binding protein
MKTSIGISEANRKTVAGQLNILLADEFVLYTKTLNAHWNIEGPDFHSVHVYFESLYGESQELIDSVAERVRQLGHYASGTLSSILKLTHLTEKYEGKNDSQSYIAQLLAGHESIIEFMRGTINEFADAHKDAGTSDFVTGLMEKHEKTAWMLRSHLK